MTCYETYSACDDACEAKYPNCGGDPMLESLTKECLEVKRLYYECEDVCHSEHVSCDENERAGN